MTIRPRRLSHVAAAALLLGAGMPSAGTADSRGADATAGELAARVPASPAAARAGATGLRALPEVGALLYVPSGYRQQRAAPLLVMLHGAGGDPRHSIALARDHADRLGFILLAPKSQAASWDIISKRSYGADVGALDAALRETFEAYNIDPERIAVGGFSDGASYALSLGLINGELFRRILAFSPGFVAPGRLRGRPQVHISHGVGDRVLPIGVTSRKIVPELRRVGYTVSYEEFAGGHEVPDRIARRFFGTLATPPGP